MKRLFSSVLAIVMILMLAACGGTGKPADTEGKSETEAPAVQIGEHDIVVSPDGDDSADGTAEHPLATVSAAKEKAKTVPGGDGITVWLKSGIYYLSDILQFNETDRTDVKYAAYGDGEAVISGGREITGWSEDELNGVACWSADMEADAAFKTLSNGKKTLPLTRFPEEGYLTVSRYCVADVTNPDSGNGAHTLAFVMKPEKITDFQNVKSVRMRMLHTWIDEYIPLDRVDLESGEVWLQWRTGVMASMGDRLYFENVLEAFDKPGEWYLDEENNKVYYIPEDGEVLDGFVLYAGKMDGLIGFNGAKNISFEGITFTGTDYQFPATAYGFGGWSPAAVSGDLSENICFDNCTFRSLGSGGISLCSRTVGCKITNCTFTDIGMVPIQQNGTYYVSEYDNTPLGAVISNNRIDGYGLTFRSCVAILSYNACGVEISHNEICNGYSCGIHITCNECDLANDTRVGDIAIKSNYIHDIGFGAINDFGAIYTNGRQPGTVISGNVIHDVHGAGASGGHDYTDVDSHGIYLDMFSSEMQVYNNLVYDCNGWGITYDGADLGVDVHNNIFAFCGGGLGVAFFINPARGLVSEVSNNIFLLESGEMLAGYMIGHEENFDEHDNLYYYLNSEEQLASDDSRVTGPIIADPLFADAEKRDFTLSDNSPAVAAGFEVWDYSEAGVK